MNGAATLKRGPTRRMVAMSFDPDQLPPEVVEQAEALLLFALGASEARPDCSALSIDTGRFTSFVRRVMSRHGLHVVRKGETAGAAPTATAAIDKPATLTAQPPTTTKPGEREAKPTLADAVRFQGADLPKLVTKPGDDPPTLGDAITFSFERRREADGK